VSRGIQLEPMTASEFDRWSAHSVEGFVRQQVEAGLQPDAEARRDAARVLADQLPDGMATEHHHFLRVVDPGRDETVGHLWLRVRPQSGEVEGYVFDIELLPAARGHGLGRATMQAAHDLARSLGATVMRLNVFGHNGTAIGLYESLGYTVAGASMHRVLDGLGEPPAGPQVHLRDMTPAEYAAFRPRLNEDYAANLSASGAMPEAEARHKAAADLHRLLPDGLATAGHRLWTAYDGTDPVGLVWVQLQDRSDGLRAFGHELSVREDLRRRGYGRAVVDATMRSCRDLGVQTVGLSVFGFDAGASRLYEELGFRLTAQTMVLPL
jgi:ribosomal protein S18 acetylase RimI-like enzyme